jgi:hypothetical protein
MPPDNGHVPSTVTPIGELHGSPSRAFDGAPDAIQNCRACGRHHGSVGEEIACLRAFHARAVPLLIQLARVASCEHGSAMLVAPIGSLTYDRKVCFDCGATMMTLDGKWALPRLVRP